MYIVAVIHDPHYAVVEYRETEALAIYLSWLLHHFLVLQVNEHIVPLIRLPLLCLRRCHRLILLHHCLIIIYRY